MCIRDRLYSVPLALKEERLDDIVCQRFGLETPGADLTEWTKMVNTALSINKKVKIGMVGKYVELRDAYLSVAEALTCLLYTSICIDSMDLQKKQTTL